MLRGLPFQGGIAGSNPVGHTTSDQPDTGAVAEEILQRRDDRVLTRVGPAVRHPRHPWSSATRALLEHLSEVAFMPSPRLVGTDGDADLLSYIPGASGADGWAPAVTEEGLAAAARLLRSYHDAVRDWRPEIEPVWFDGSVGTGGPGEVVCHGDFGPWNIVWDGTTPVGLLDFEYARPGDPLNDVAYACEYFVPFRDDAECLRWLRYPEPPDRRRRLLIFAESYGPSSADGLVDRVIAIQSDMRALVARLAGEGFPRQVEQVTTGYLEVLQGTNRLVIAAPVSDRPLIKERPAMAEVVAAGRSRT
jgi:hypothetical protein